jgi:hydrogenase maturation protease
MTGPLCIIGMGNALQGDDGVGLAVVRGLAAAGVGSVRGAAVELDAAGADATIVAARLAEGSSVILVDAADMGARPGTWRMLDAAAVRSGQVRAEGSTHALSAAAAVSLAAALGVEGNLRILGIQPRTMGAGQGLSDEVAAALPAVIAALRSEVTA